MSASDLLGTYLNDHLGGAGAGVEMARTLQDSARGGPDEELLGPIADEVEQDRETLRQLIAKLGVMPNAAKRAAGWVAEKAHRVGVAEQVTGSADLTRLLQAESLSLGIEGKLGLWLALQEITPAHPQLAEVDLAGLAERAREQRRRVDAVRLVAARRTFTDVDG